VHLTLGILRQSQAFFYALSFFWLDGFAVTRPSAGNANRWVAGHIKTKGCVRNARFSSWFHHRFSSSRNSFVGSWFTLSVCNYSAIDTGVFTKK
jgi:hypothetical protein